MVQLDVKNDLVDTSRQPFSAFCARSFLIWTSIMESRGMVLCLLMLVIVCTTWSAKLEDREDIQSQENLENLVSRLANRINDKTRIKTEDDDAWRSFGRSSNPVVRHLRKSRRSLRAAEKEDAVPFSNRRFQKMLEKAILKIITGDLTDADITLLKGLNYSLEEVLAIRERELSKRIPEPSKIDDNLDSGKMEMIQTAQSLTESTKTRHKVLGTTDSTVVTSSSKKSNKNKNQDTLDPDFDFDAYNKQAVYDYENAANKMSEQSELDRVSSIIDYEDPVKETKEVVQVEDNLHANFDRAMESHVVFKIRYDDSEFDSTSDERMKQLSRERDGQLDRQNLFGESRSKPDNVMSSMVASLSSEKLDPVTINTTPGNHGDKTFHSSTFVDTRSSVPLVYKLNNFVTPHEETTTIHQDKLENTAKDLGINDKFVENGNSKIDDLAAPSLMDSDHLQVDLLAINKSSDDPARSSMYEGLEWVEDDVYRVIPQTIDDLNYDNVPNDLENDTIEESNPNANRTSELMFYDDKNYTLSYQNESPDDENQTFNSTRPINANLSAYQQLAMAHRRDQGQKAIEDIKLKVLALTGRFNLSSSSNQVQRERLTMFSPICQTPRNTDLDTWADPFSMNMYFQLNLTSGDHVVAAKMRIYKLPQNINSSTSATTAAVEEEDDEEKKIRISTYFYTKSLKKHRCKKRLMDSVVTSLTSQGSHLALDVRQALRFWRQNSRSSSHVSGNSNNHGLVIQVEDQDGKPLKPSNYIHQDSCHTSEQTQDDKAYQRVPALFVQACSRYVRVVNGEAVTYVNCSKSLRSDRH